MIAQFENRAEVTVLDRSIQIQGDGASLGCQLLLASGSKTRIQGVSIIGCGQLASAGAALQIEGTEEASISECVIQGSKAAGIVARGTDGLQLEGNVIIGSVGSSVSVLNSSNARYTLPEDVRAAFLIPAGKSVKRTCPALFIQKECR